METAIGLVLLLVAVVVGFTLGREAERNVRGFDESEHVPFITEAEAEG